MDAHRSRADISKDHVLKMRKLTSVNCLHRGDIENVEGKRWMVAIDGTEASLRAWNGTLKMLGPMDHLVVVTVRDKNLPERFSLHPVEMIQLHFELWKSAHHILKPFLHHLAETMVGLGRSATLFFVDMMTTVSSVLGARALHGDNAIFMGRQEAALLFG